MSWLVSVFQESLLYTQLEHRFCTSTHREAITSIPLGADVFFQQMLSYWRRRRIERFSVGTSYYMFLYRQYPAVKYVLSVLGYTMPDPYPQSLSSTFCKLQFEIIIDYFSLLQCLLPYIKQNIQNIKYKIQKIEYMEYRILKIEYFLCSISIYSIFYIIYTIYSIFYILYSI